MLMVAIQRALADPEYWGGDGGPSGAFGVEWPLGESYDNGFQIPRLLDFRKERPCCEICSRTLGACSPHGQVGGGENRKYLVVFRAKEPSIGLHD